MFLLTEAYLLATFNSLTKETFLAARLPLSIFIGSFDSSSEKDYVKVGGYFLFSA